MSQTDKNKTLITTLEAYRKIWLEQPRFSTAQAKETHNNFLQFALSEPECFERTLSHGHVTASTVITSIHMDKVLLTHHRKLGKWLQLGGHADGDFETDRVAQREAIEESGLQEIQFVEYENKLQPSVNIGRVPIELDIHEIPERPGEPRHLHYDLCYLVMANASQPLVCSHESKEVRWFDLKSVPQVTKEPTIFRQLEKLEYVKTYLSEH